MQENGPFIWQYGTYLPVKNPWTWVNLTNMVWVEQPVGTGFSQGTPDATSEADVASEFLGFFKNFVDTFGLHNRKIYVTGESYAGYYVPYIADAMLNQNDTTYYGVESIMIYDPSTSTDAVQEQSKYFLLVFVSRSLIVRQYLPWRMLTTGLLCSPSTPPSWSICMSKPTLVDTPHFSMIILSIHLPDLFQTPQWRTTQQANVMSGMPSTTLHRS